MDVLDLSVLADKLPSIKDRVAAILERCYTVSYGMCYEKGGQTHQKDLLWDPQTCRLTAYAETGPSLPSLVRQVPGLDCEAAVGPGRC
jgi:hypothetical protein